ncbi:MAG TPA: response regulator transcription factor [Chthoniobacterales bacterium]
MRLRILIADDHALLREGTRVVIDREPGWEICGQASNGREAVEQAIALKPDIVILDMTMPELNGLDAAVQIMRQVPGTEVAMLSAYGSEDLIRSAFGAGVKSFILKTEAEDFLVDAVKSLAQHERFLTPRVSQILFSGLRDAPTGGAELGPTQRLTTREREVVQLLAEGKANKEVAEKLQISVRTAENHRASILRKLGLDSVADLVRYAIRNQLIEP